MTSETFLINFTRELLKVDPMERQAFITEWALKLDAQPSPLLSGGVF